MTSNIGQCKCTLSSSLTECEVVKMCAFSSVVYFVLSSLLVCCAAEIERRWPHDTFPLPFQLLSIRAERYILPILPYDLGSLEPYIDRETVVAHYEGHHEAYRRKMNVALNEWREDVSPLQFFSCSVNFVILLLLTGLIFFQSPKCRELQTAD